MGSEQGGFQGQGRRKLRKGGEAEQRKNLSVALRSVLPWNHTPTSRLGKNRVLFNSTLLNSVPTMGWRRCLIHIWLMWNWIFLNSVPGTKLQNRRDQVWPSVSDTLLNCTVAKNKTVFTRKLDFYLDEFLIVRWTNYIKQINNNKEKSETQMLLGLESTGLRERGTQAEPKENSAYQT